MPHFPPHDRATPITATPITAMPNTATPNTDYVARYGRVGVAIAATVVAVSLFTGPAEADSPPIDVAPADAVETTTGNAP